MIQSDQSPGIGALIGGLASDVQTLVRGELALARTELDAKISSAAGALSPTVAGAVVGFGGFVVVLIGIAYGLALVLPIWLAFLIVGTVAVVIGGIISRSGIQQLKSVNLVPARAAASLQKDANMVKEHLS